MNALRRAFLRARFRWWAPLRRGRHASYYDSHSQFGEDMVVRALLDDQPHGTFVDLGAHHPVYYSNTYYFYVQGWRGLNVDALPGSMDAFRVLRPHDRNVEACLGAHPGETVTFFEFADAALSTVDPAVAERLQAEGHHLRSARARSCVTLTQCLDEHLPHRAIDFLSVDVEGLDEAILRSLDWARYAPRVIACERHDVSFADASGDSLLSYLQGRGYVVEAKCGPTFILQQQRASMPQAGAAAQSAAR